MQDCKYHDTLGFDAIEDGKGKPRENCTANLPVHKCENFRILLYGIEYAVDGSKKLVAKTVTLFVVPTEITSKISSDLAPIDNRQSWPAAEQR